MALPNEVKVIALNDVMSALTGAEMLEDGNAKKNRAEIGGVLMLFLSL